MSQWVQMSNGMGTNRTVKAFTSNGTNIFAGAGENDSGAYSSTNNGTTWIQAGLNDKKIISFAVLGNNIFAGAKLIFGNNGGVYRSTNNGTNWTLIRDNSATWNALAINGNNIFAGGTYGSNPISSYIFLSTNLGTNWTTSFIIPNNNVYSLAVGGNNIYSGIQNSGVYISTNNGSNWTQTTLTNYTVLSLATNGSNIFAGTDNNGVFRSTNDGTTWTQTTLNNQNVNSLVVSGNNIFAGTQNFGIWLSTNNGTNWIQKNEGFTMIPSVYALYITNNFLFAGTDAQSVWRRPLSDLGIGIKNISSEVPSSYSLSQNYPNPFNPSTNVQFSIPNVQFVSLKVFDMLGKEVATLVNEKLKAGTFETTFDGSNISSGIYFYKLETENFSDVKKMVLVK